MKVFLSVSAMVLVACWTQQGLEPVELAEAEALSRLTHRIEPKPPFPESTMPEGVVKLKVHVTPEGLVEKAEIISGNFLLTGAAEEAVLQWTFKPLIEEGVPIPFVAELQIPFKLDIPQEVRDRREKFMDLVRRGQIALEERNDTAEAERLLEEAVLLGEQLSAGDYPHLTRAIELLGQTYLSQNRYADAEGQFHRELEILQEHEEEARSEIGTVFVNLGVVCELAGHDKRAESFLLQGVAVFERLAAEDHLDELRRNYQRTAVEIWAELGLFCRRVGKTQEAREYLGNALKRAKEVGYDDLVSILEENLQTLNEESG